MEDEAFAMPPFGIEALAAKDFEQVQVLRDADLGLLAFVVIHSTRLGPAFGGIRRWAYGDPSEGLADALRLAEHMTYKCAIHGVAGGGGKVVMLDNPAMDRRGAYLRLGEFIQEMSGRFYTGPDVGTDSSDLLVMGEVTDYVALPDERGTGELSGPTALGVFSGVRAVAGELGFPSLEGVHVVVQGLGGVGWSLCGLLAEAGAEISVCDVLPDRVDAACAEWDVAVVAPQLAYAVTCDIYAPCALGGVIRHEIIDDLGAKAIAGSANNVLASAECGEELFRRGVLYAPDFVINSGGLVHGALFHIEGKSPTPARVEAIGGQLTEIFAQSSASGVPPEVVAEGIARERLSQASDSPFFPGRKE
jgi:leucine dehydrogenase